MKKLELTNEEYQMVMDMREQKSTAEFSKEIAILFAFQSKISEIRKQIKKTEKDLTIVSSLKNKNFTVVIHGEKEASIINYKKEKDNDEKYYSIEYEEGKLIKGREDVTDEDFQFISEIINNSEINDNSIKKDATFSLSTVVYQPIGSDKHTQNKNHGQVHQ